MFEVAKPSIRNAREYAKLIIKCAPRMMQERLAVASQYGWDAKEVKDEVFFEEYQKLRACILFPHNKKDIERNIDNLNVSEVDKAEVFFTKATGLALKEPSLSLTELGDFLTQLHTASQTEDTSPADSSETGAEQS